MGHCLDRNHRLGFTLVELTIVVMILGILAGVAAPRYQTALAGFQLECAAKRLASDLRQAQSLARLTSTKRGLQFFTLGNAYETLDDATHAAIPDPDRPADNLSVWFGGGDSRIALTAADFSGSTSAEFDFRGDPVAIGSATISGSGGTRIVHVRSAGLVEVETP